MVNTKDVPKKIIEGCVSPPNVTKVSFFISAALTLLDVCGNSRGEEIAL